MNLGLRENPSVINLCKISGVLLTHKLDKPHMDTHYFCSLFRAEIQRKLLKGRDGSKFV